MKVRPATVALGLVAIWLVWWGSCEAISRLTEPPARSLGAPTTKEKVQVQDLVIGQGPGAKKGDTITMKYVGTLTDGKVFDSTETGSRQPITFRIGEGSMIPGWDIGLVGIRVGGKRRLRVPPSLGYPQGTPDSTIPPNSTLIFEVERIK